MISYAFGFSPRKLVFLKQFLRARHGTNVIVRTLNRSQDLPAHSTLYIWGMATTPTIKQPHRIVRVEDGFLRSAGLGAALTRPMSWVFDDEGLYFDASRPSQLETLLQTTTLDCDGIDEAKRLRDKIVTTRVSKYNLDNRQTYRFPSDRKVILVAGQVEDDASILWGADRIRSNLELVDAVKAAHPEDYLIYKPHPDVVSGLRSLGRNEEQALRVADHVVTQGDVISLLPCLDAVHVNTSLTGFEALLRGVPVVCWGRPFYAGWGLTRDQSHFPRRLRRLSIDELVYGALIAYPCYLSPQGCLSSAEDTVDVLARLREDRSLMVLHSLSQFLQRLALKLRAKRN